MLIGRLVRFLVPRQDGFFSLLEEIAAKMTAASVVFSELATASHHDQFKAIAVRLKLMETEADAICQRLYEALDRTFVTPIHSEDLLHLTRALDNVIDTMEHAAAFAALFRFSALTEPMRQMARITALAVAEIDQAVVKLRHFKDANTIHDATVAIHTFENEADALYRGALAALFDDGIDGRELVRQKDMLFALEKGVDRCENAMDAIRSVIVKNG
jgi:uncharacterized protein